MIKRKKIVINEDEAETVRLIFSLFLSGLTPNAIARELTRRGIKTPMGKDTWYQGTVSRMLQNEKYKGDALLQKNITTDYLSHKMKKNEGEAPQYYITGNHEAIISPEVWEMVQGEMERRKNQEGRYSGVSIFSNRIKCAECGGWYGAKVWHSNDPYRKVIYRCNRKYEGERCGSPHVTEEEIKEAFIRAYNKVVRNKKEIIQNVKEMMEIACRMEGLEEKKTTIETELGVIGERVQSLIDENKRIAMDQGEYTIQYNGLVEKYENMKEEYEGLTAAIREKESHRIRIEEFLVELQKRHGVLDAFDENLWSCMVEYVEVGEEIKVKFKGGIIV